MSNVLTWLRPAAWGLGVVMVTLAAALLAAATGWPIQTPAPGPVRAASARVPALPVLEADVSPLLGQMRSRQLVRPAQMQPAVRDAGTAERLLKQMALLGVVQIGEEHVAYVRVEGRGTRTVRAGEPLLEFIVNRVEPGKIGLRLEGVQAELTH